MEGVDFCVQREFMQAEGQNLIKLQLLTQIFNELRENIMRRRGGGVDGVFINKIVTFIRFLSPA